MKLKPQMPVSEFEKWAKHAKDAVNPPNDPVNPGEAWRITLKSGDSVDVEIT